MTHKQALYFEAAFSARNIAAAADAMFVSRSVISRSIAELEKEFGAVLFDRSKEGVEPTEAGLILHRMIVEMGSSYSAVMECLHSLDSEKNGRRLRIAITPTNIEKLYDLLFRDFLEENPDIRLQISEKPAGETITFLLDGSTDVIFTPQNEELSSMFERIDIYKSRIVLGINASSPLAKKSEVSISDLLDLSFGLLEAPMPIEDILKSGFSAFGKEPKVLIRTSRLEVLQKMTEDGHVAVILPQDNMENWDNVVGIPMEFLSASTHRMIWSRTVPHNSAFNDFINFVKRKCELDAD